MKPRKRPGKAAGARSSKCKAGNPLSEKEFGAANNRAGRGGKKADWQPDFEEGRVLALKPMPNREPEGLSEDGIRRYGKGH